MEFRLKTFTINHYNSEPSARHNGEPSARLTRTPIALHCAAMLGALFLVSCGGGDAPVSSGISLSCSASDPAPTGGSGTPTGTNVVAVTVDGYCALPAVTGGKPNPGAFNLACASVTVCNHGGACATVPNILVDTGSYGLRIFRSAITAVNPAVTLTPVASGGGQLAECMYFGSNNDWGQVMTADVKLGGEPTLSNIPIQVIDASFGTVPTACKSPFPVDTGPADAGINGILGVGLGTQDCPECATSPGIPVYYSCTGSNCTTAVTPLANQVVNPVAKFTFNGTSTDNNGVMMEFPSVPTEGTASSTGYLVFGVGTQSNNTPPAGVSTFLSDNQGEITTTLNGRTYPGLIDSGTDVLLFPSTGINNLGSFQSSSFYSPSCNVNLTATMNSSGSATTEGVTFQIADLSNVTLPSNFVLSNVGANPGTGPVGNLFIWGLPFFYGRTVYVGISGMTSSLGTGPYEAY